jgi:hypothetical protein
MVDAFSSISSHILDLSKNVELDTFMSFEPWDVERRPDWFTESCKADGINFNEYLKIIPPDPHPFQTGSMMSTNILDCTIAGSQLGKSFPEIVDTIIQLTGEVPFSMKFEKGVDTGILRPVTVENVKRWGRRDAVSGTFIDRDIFAVKDPQAWNCGTIIGCGLYPKEKICPTSGGMAWVGTTKEAKNQFWWPKFKDIIPKHLLDRKRGIDGFSELRQQVHLVGGATITIITYEQGYNRFEARRVWKIILDEEPEDRRIFTAALGHCERLRMSFTPYNGISWSYFDIFKKIEEGARIGLYHATQYDSPYQTRADVDERKSIMKKWEIAARVYGLYSEQTGRPYYDRDKVYVWLNSHVRAARYASFMPTKPASTIYELVSTPVSMIDRPAIDSESEQDVWEIYEDVRPGCEYWMGVDTSDGAEEISAAADRSAAIIMRLPDEKAGEHEPVIVAAIRSIMQPSEFSRVCLYACVHYNNALLCPETRGQSAATFLATIRDYPYIFKMTVIRDADRKTTEHLGFDTNARTRKLIFDLVGDWIKSHEGDPRIPHMSLLREISACVVGEDGRPDHTTGKTLDSTVAFGIALYVFKYGREQIRDYSIGIQQESIINRRHSAAFVETRPVLGSTRGLDMREKFPNAHTKQRYNGLRGHPSAI